MTVRAEPVEAAQELGLRGLFSMAAEHNAHCGFDKLSPNGLLDAVV
jgi:hypothetical protein